MGTWLLLLLTQTILIATGNASLHKKLGIASLPLPPAIILTAMVLVPTMHAEIMKGSALASSEMAGHMRLAISYWIDSFLFEIRASVLFALFVFLALRARRKNSGFHQRLLIIATLMPLPAAINRITWLPHTMPESALSADLYTLLWLSPMFIWDMLRLGRVHRAYVVWFALWIPASVAVHLLWGSDWWQATAPGLLGFS